MSSSAAVYEVTSEHARITQQEAPDYFSIPWNDDFSTNYFFVLSYLDLLVYGICPVVFAVAVWRMALTHSDS